MIAWWRSRQARERAFLGAALLFAAAVLGYLLVWEPLQQRRAELRRGVAGLRADLDWMRSAAAEVKRLHAQAAAGASGAAGASLLTLVDASARSAGLAQALKRLEPHESQLRVQLEQVEFDTMLRWLEQLASQHGIAPSTAVVNRAAPGRVDARLVLGFSR